MRNVLIVEDDVDIAQLLAVHLRDLPAKVVIASTGASGLDHIRSGNFDLVVLDLMLPDIDGLDVCRTMRADAITTPVLVVTARAAEPDRVCGLDTGADDYVVKPFSVREILARAHGLLRRSNRGETPWTSAEAVVIAGDLRLDLPERRASLAGTELGLTAKEFDLLLAFARHPGRVYTRGELMVLVWGFAFEHGGHVVNSHINRLRAKMERVPLSGVCS